MAQGKAAADSVPTGSWGFHRVQEQAMRAAGLDQLRFETRAYCYEYGATTTAVAYRRQDEHLRRWEGTGIWPYAWQR